MIFSGLDLASEVLMRVTQKSKIVEYVVGIRTSEFHSGNFLSAKFCDKDPVPKPTGPRSKPQAGGSTKRFICHRLVAIIVE